MSELAALVRMIEPIPEATKPNLVAAMPGDHPANGRRAPAWDTLLDDRWIARLSDGEKARLQLGLQLYNGGSIDREGQLPWNLRRCWNALDTGGRRDLIDALEDMSR